MHENIQEILSKARKEGRRALLEPEAEKICGYSGIPVPKSFVATADEEAAAKAEELGFPAVLKIVSPDITHKTEAGGVLVGLRDRDEVKRGFQDIIANAKNYKPDAGILGVLVQRMVPEGIEVIVGGLRDPQFGATVMFGMGGILVEIFKDIVFDLAPLEKPDAYDMVRSIKAYPLLKGYRNMQRADEDAIVDILLKASWLISEYSEIDQMDLNPIRVWEKGATVVDARILCQ
jgi:acyl-CoA synthetase (NDP forming)